jgi:hypothetical protein
MKGVTGTSQDGSGTDAAARRQGRTPFFGLLCRPPVFVVRKERGVSLASSTHHVHVQMHTGLAT